MSVQFTRSDMEVNAVTGAGTAIGTAAALKPGVNVLSVATGAKGGRLPALMCSPVYVRLVSTGSAGYVYPPAGGKINALGSASGIVLSAAKVAWCFPHPNGLDYVVFKAA